MPTIIPRSAWGAAPPRVAPTRVTWPRGGTLWVHYSDGPPPADDYDDERATIRAIQRFHQGTRQWADIGYSYVVAPSGRVYEGRGYGILAAHCPGHNDEPSVCLLWQDGDSLPPRAALDAVLDLARGIGASKLAPHREGFPTACPGDAIAAWVDAHRCVDEDDSLTLTDRLRLAGFGARSVRQVIDALRAWDGKTGTPRPVDSELFRRLRAAGFGANSARAIIYALRRRGSK